MIKCNNCGKYIENGGKCNCKLDNCEYFKTYEQLRQIKQDVPNDIRNMESITNQHCPYDDYEGRKKWLAEMREYIKETMGDML